LAHAWRELRRISPSCDSHHISFINQDHAIRDQVSVANSCVDHDDGHAKGALQFQNQLIDSCGDDRIESGGGSSKNKTSGSIAKALATQRASSSRAELRRL